MTAIKTCRSARWLGDRVQKARLWTGQDKTRGRMRYALGSEGLPNIVQRIKRSPLHLLGNPLGEVNAAVLVSLSYGPGQRNI